MQRRRFLQLSAHATAASVAGVGLAGLPARAEGGDPISLAWGDLVPGGQAVDSVELLFAIIEHGQSVDYGGSELVSDYNGKRVKLPGYMVPLEFEEDGVRNFLLVPFIGACIHVPPPPANQLVLVKSDTPYPANDYFDAVTVVGLFDHLPLELDMGEIGYLITAERVAAYDG